MNQYFGVYADGKPFIYGKDLKGAWDKIPTALRNKLNIQLEGDLVLTGWQQFLSRYRDSVVAYTELEDAETDFITTFMGNRFIVEQIGNLNRALEDINNMDNWKDVVTNYAITTSEGAINASGAGLSKTGSKIDNVNKISNKNTDSNSYTLQGQTAPYNQLIDTENITANINEDNTSNLNYNTTNNRANSKTGSKTESTNNAKDAIEYVNLKLNDLYAKFWGKFFSMFLKC